jgi:hypothetical protein
MKKMSDQNRNQHIKRIKKSMDKKVKKNLNKLVSSKAFSMLENYKTTGIEPNLTDVGHLINKN